MTNTTDPVALQYHPALNHACPVCEAPAGKLCERVLDGEHRAKFYPGKMHETKVKRGGWEQTVYSAAGMPVDLHRDRMPMAKVARPVRLVNSLRAGEKAISIADERGGGKGRIWYVRLYYVSQGDEILYCEAGPMTRSEADDLRWFADRDDTDWLCAQVVLASQRHTIPVARRDARFVELPSQVTGPHGEPLVERWEDVTDAVDELAARRPAPVMVQGDWLDAIAV